MKTSIQAIAGLAFAAGVSCATCAQAAGPVLRTLAGPAINCIVSGCDKADPVRVTITAVPEMGDVPAHCVAVLPGNITVASKADRDVVWKLEMKGGGPVTDYEFQTKFGVLVIDGYKHVDKNGRGDGDKSTDATLYFVKRKDGNRGDTITYLPVVQQLSGEKVMCAAIDPKITNDT